ncbi:hypothetical protein HZC07_00885 [Candidatus Micrarchaeota archaeon]|nr:hypothetical protein [Candidatus Micrarchaeota archaeon]
MNATEETPCREQQKAFANMLKNDAPFLTLQALAASRLGRFATWGIPHSAIVSDASDTVRRELRFPAVAYYQLDPLQAAGYFEKF